MEKRRVFKNPGQDYRLRKTFLTDSVNEAACMVNQRQMGVMENVSS